VNRCREVVERLRAIRNEDNIAGMARYGIKTDSALGASMPALRKMARELSRDHELALDLWTTGIHEARILACLVDDPVRVTKKQMETWVKDFDSWDVCDQVCMNLFDKTPFAYEKALEWSSRRAEFVKRAGFAMMAALAVHDKQAADEAFRPFLAVIVRQSTDDRNFVRKAVNWALRSIGKRNLGLNKKAVATAKSIQKVDSRTARWIAADAIRELTSDRIQKKLVSRASPGRKSVASKQSSVISKQ
jgi:3-methyladenine DNA glycosylase AlkD